MPRLPGSGRTTAPPPARDANPHSPIVGVVDVRDLPYGGGTYMNVDFRADGRSTPALLVSVLPNPQHRPWVYLETPGAGGNGRSTVVVAPAPRAPTGGGVIAAPPPPRTSGPPPSSPGGRGAPGPASSGAPGTAPLRLGDVFAFAGGFPRIDWDVIRDGPDAEELALLREHYGPSFRWVPASQYGALDSPTAIGATLGIYHAFQSIRRAKENGTVFLTALQRSSYRAMIAQEEGLRGRPLSGAEERDILRGVVSNSYLQDKYRGEYSPGEIAAVEPTDAEREKLGFPAQGEWQTKYREWVEGLRRNGEMQYYQSFDEWFSGRHREMVDGILAARMKGRRREP